MRTGRLIASILSLVAVAVVAACSSDADPPEPTTGDWHGSILIPDHPLGIGVTFTAEHTATIDIPSQGMTGVALKDVRTDRGGVEFAIPDIPGDPVFKGRYESDRITGDFTQSGQSYPTTLERGKIAGPARPQEPKPPFPYRSEDVTYRSGDITVAGTLTTPQGPGPFPAVLMITGSGAQNRDEELMGHKPFLLLADTMTRAGYAVLRTDDRGVGGTGGDLGQASYPMLAGDAAAGVRFLRDRGDIDPARVGLFGHSEGGYLAPLVASAPDSGVAFVILMAGPAVPGGDVLIEQTRVIMAADGASQEDIDREVATSTEMVRLLKAGDIEGAKAFLERANAEASPDERVPDEQVDAQITPYFTALITYDPTAALSALRVPVLAFFGDKDLQVLATQNEGPTRTLLAADPDATVRTFAGLNHLMQPTATGKPSEYAGNEITLAPEVLTTVTDWLTQRFPPR
ncbi:alpha/beta hydrolase family protein [Nocardia arizonensis]|uniref:alpha/beta hydrolase family protein n=1 Tax=Nocardia arizonensis TaxID=1141647 RepID=UPI0006D081A3|nr:alpha/beta fold hydrolase [Nocardia arizonensis]